MRPGARPVTMQCPISVGDRIDGKQAILALGANKVREFGGGVFAPDDAVDDDMADMDSPRSKFPRQALRHGPQRRFGGGEGKEGRAGAQRGGGAGKKERSPLAGQKPADGFAAGPKSPQGVLPPQGLDELGIRFERGRRDIVAGVIDGQLEIIFAIGLLEERGDIRLARGIGELDHGLAARRANPIGDRLQALLRAAGDDDPQAFARKTPRQSGAKSRFGAHPDNDGCCLGSNRSPPCAGPAVRGRTAFAFLPMTLRRGRK